MKRLRKRLERRNCKNNDYTNKSELDKLYKIIEMGCKEILVWK